MNKILNEDSFNGTVDIIRENEPKILTEIKEEISMINRDIKIRDVKYVNGDTWYDFVFETEITEVLERDLKYGRTNLISMLHSFRQELITEISIKHPLLNANLNGYKINRSDRTIQFSITLIFTRTPIK